MDTNIKEEIVHITLPHPRANSKPKSVDEVVVATVVEPVLNSSKIKKPRKYVYTENRQSAFKKCQEARKMNLELRKKAKSLKEKDLQKESNSV